MGDTGSLMVGLVNAILIVKFIDVAGNPSGKLPVASVPAVAIAILILPLFDTLRVFAIRMMRGRSPFTADRNHIHHYLLALNLTHRQTALVCVVVNAAYIAMGFIFQHIGPTWLLAAEISSALALTGILYQMKRRKENMVHRVSIATAAVTDPATVVEPISKSKVLRINPKGILQDK